MPFTPFLHFSGDCEEAITTYCKIFGGEELLIRHEPDINERNSDTSKKPRVAYASFIYEGGAIMGDDLPVGREKPQESVTIYHMLGSLDRAKKLFRKLSEGGEVRAPFKANMHSPGSGTLRDRFGTEWTIMVLGD